MDSDARPVRRRRNLASKKKESRLASIQRLEPLSSRLPRWLAPPEGESADASFDEAREQRLRLIQQRLQEGAYAVPADTLAELLAKIFFYPKKRNPPEEDSEPTA